MLRRRVVALAALFTLTVACTSGGGSGRETASPAPERWRGGTLRIADWVGGPFLDPAQAWAGYGTAAELLRCCLARTLVSYGGRPAEEGGSEPEPDLAAAMPEVSADGLTWTFRLREGLRYGPPFDDTEIIAGDVVRALERTANPSSKALYPTYFSVVEGFDSVVAGEATTISGLEVPDQHTLVVRLLQPAGDLGYRFSLPTTAPIPEGAADGHRNYGPYLVSSGPYMLEGSEALDFSLPVEDQQPAAGYGKENFTFVRNPSWDPRTDPLRPAYVDRIVIVNHGEGFGQAMAAAEDPAEAYNDFYYALQAETAREVDQGIVDLSLAALSPAEQVRRYQTDPVLRERLVTGTGDRLYYSAFNLAVPPFDDVHVRRAVSLAFDRARLVRIMNDDPDWLGATVANHLAPDGTEDFLLAAYRPSWSVSDGPDPEAARAEMRRSRYDTDGDGSCDAPACLGVEVILEESEVDLHPWPSFVREALGTVGIEPRIRVLGYEDGVVQAILGPGESWGTYLCIYCNYWVVDYPGASSVFVATLYGPSIAETWNQNVSLMGATSDQLRGWGYSVDAVPNADGRIEACQRQVGSAQIACWAEFDQYVMEEVVPWIPLFFVAFAFPVSERVEHSSFDQRTGLPAFDQIALVPGSE